MKKKYNSSRHVQMALVLIAALQSPNTLAQAHEHSAKPQKTQTHTSHNDSAPPVAQLRNPHAYSSGFTLTQGPYAQTGPRQLVLADEHRFWTFVADRVEQDLQEDALSYDSQFWYGTTFKRLVVKAEGEAERGNLSHASNEVHYSHAISAFFNAQAGLRHDYNQQGENRTWLALGLQGLAPYWFELDMTAYLSSEGHTALSVEAEYDLLLSQRWVLQPRLEFNLYGKDDLDNSLGSGLTSLSAGLRLRYEVSRQFAPYLGVEWQDTFGQTREQARQNGQSTDNTRYMAGVTFWF